MAFFGALGQVVVDGGPVSFVFYYPLRDGVDVGFEGHFSHEVVPLLLLPFFLLFVVLVQQQISLHLFLLPHLTVEQLLVHLLANAVDLGTKGALLHFLLLLYLQFL